MHRRIEIVCFTSIKPRSSQEYRIVIRISLRFYFFFLFLDFNTDVTLKIALVATQLQSDLEERAREREKRNEKEKRLRHFSAHNSGKTFSAKKFGSLSLEMVQVYKSQNVNR